jgi:hypothetical protein
MLTIARMSGAAFGKADVQATCRHASAHAALMLSNVSEAEAVPGTDDKFGP